MSFTGSSFGFSSLTVAVLSLSGFAPTLVVERIGLTGSGFRIGIVVVALLWFVDSSTVVSGVLTLSFPLFL